MSKKFVRILCLVMSIVLVVGLLAGLLATVAAAADTTYQLHELLADGKIKPLGRTQTSLAGDSITADWSGSGFDINVSGDGGTMTVGFSANYTAYWAVLVDGDQVWRGYTATGTGTFSAEIPAGKHTVRVVKETQMSNSETGYSYLTTLAFGGTIEAAPAKSSLYIEFVGDSITCGDGALGEYEPGVAWLKAHDSATHSYAYYAAEKLGADYSLVARGGIGLFTGISEQEGTAQKKGMQDIYNYVSAYNPTSNGEYSFSRQPQVVFIELGANDSIDSKDQYKTIAYWKGLMEDFIDQVRGKNPNAQIVLHSTNATKYKALMQIVESRKESDPKLHTFYYAYLGNGSAALADQEAGHPDAADLERFGDALAKFLKAQDIVPTYTATPSYTDITYFVSENGNDSNDGKTIDTAKKTLNAAVNQARTDNGTFAAGSRVVVYVQGTVKGSSNNNQGLLTGGVLKDTNGARVPVLVTTYNYNGTKAVLNTGHAALDDGNGTIVFYNDVTLKDIIFQSTTNEAKGYRDRTLGAGYGVTVTYDNVTFDMNGSTPTNNSGWRVTAGTGFGSDALPTSTSVTTVIFKNGDYTNLSLATACLSNGLWKSNTETVYDVPNAQYRLIIEDGAKMSTVYNRYGTLNIGKADVVINGGSVQQYVGTHSGTSSSNRRTYTGDVNLTVNGGEIYGTHFSTLGAYVKLNGNINTTINGGIFRITPQDTASQYDAYFFGGRQNCVVENINNTITGGQFYLIYDVAGVDSAYYFGASGSGSAKNVTNKISGGLFMPYAHGATGKEAHVYLGNHTGAITGTLRNEITGGNFVLSLSGLENRKVNAGSRGANCPIGKIENVIGTKGSKHGPKFVGAILQLAGGWAQVGTSTKLTAQPTQCSDTVVLSNTIYSGCFGAVYMGATSQTNTTDKYYSFIAGSVKNDIYGGFFQSTDIYCAGNTAVHGHVTTNIYGGHFRSIYGGMKDQSKAYDGVELNIYGMDEYYPVKPNDSWVFCAGNASGKVPVPATEGRAAIKLTVAPAEASDLTLNTKLKVGSTDGTTSVAVSGGLFPRGFAVDGKTVGSALASGCTVFDAATGNKASFAASDASVSGSVAVDKDGDGYTNHLEYYVSEDGLDAYSGTSPVTPKKTLKAAFDRAVSDNGNSRVFPAGTKLTIYVEGTVNDNSGQPFLYNKLLTTADGKHMETVVTTYNYSGTKATIVHNYEGDESGQARSYTCTDLTLRNVDVMTKTPASGKYQTTSIHAAGCTVTFDNVNLFTDNGKKWELGCDHYSTGGINPVNGTEMTGTLIFKNGDYTGLGYVSTVRSGSIWVAKDDTRKEFPNMHCKVIIEDGAQMGTVYNCYGALAVGSATVEIKGGSVETFIGTRSNSSANLTYNTLEMNNIISGGTVKSFMGTGSGGKTGSTSYYVTVNGNINNTFSGGTVGGKQLSGLNDYVKLNGDLTNTFSGANVVLTPTDPDNQAAEGIFLAGRATVTVTGDVTNNISAGKLGMNYPIDGIYSGIWMGLRSGTIKGNLTNNITGGEIYIRLAEGLDVAKAEYADFHTGCFSGGSITGTLTNNITGGTFEIPRGSYYLGQQGVSGYTGKIVTILGDKETGNGPVFKGTQSIMMSGNFGRIGVTSNSSTMPAATDCTDTVVISNKIYGGTFNTVYATVASGNTNNVGYVKGSVETDVYGGTFTTFYGTGNAPIYGKATTNIYGGTFNAIYGTRNGTVYDGVELNIFGLTEGSTPTGIFNSGTAKIYTQTAGRDAVKLTIDPKTALTLSMPIAVNKGTVTGTTTALVTGGTYTKGFAIEGLKVKDVLATGLVPLKDSDKTIVKVTADMTTTGTDSVTLVTTEWTGDTAAVTLSDTTVTWDGDYDAKVPTATVKFHNTTLVKGTDYTVAYYRDGAITTDFNSLGTVTVTAIAKAPYSGTASATYTIVRDEAVGKAIEEVTADVNGLDKATVTADDKAELASLKARLEAILDTHDAVLTAQEKASLAALEETRRELENVIVSVEATLAALVEDANAYSAASVTADDEADLTKLASDIAAIPDGNLTAAQKGEKKAAADQVAALQKVIADTAADLAALKGEVEAYDKASVTADDSEELTALAEKVQAFPENNLSVAQKAEKKALADEVAALQKVITDAAADLEAVKTEAAKYDAASVTADDEADLTKLAADIAAIPDGNLTAAQKSEKKAAADQVAALQKVITDTAADLAALKTKVEAYDKASVTANDSDKLIDLAAEITAYPENNLTAAQKAEKKALLDDVAALQKVITDAAADLEAVKTEAAKYDAASVTADDSDELTKLAADIAAISDGNLTAAQKSEKKAAADKVAQLQKIIADAAAGVKALQDEEASFQVDKLTISDKSKLQALAKKLEEHPTDNLTDGQKELLEQLAATTADKIAIIEKMEQIAGDIGAIEALLAGKTTQNITSDDATDVQAAKKAIEELEKDTSLSAADKAKLAQLETKADELIAQLEKADKANDVPEAVAALKPETVELADKAALEAAIDKLEKAEADYGANYTEAEKKAIQDAKAELAAVLAVVEEVEAVQKQIADLPATAEPDDEKAIAGLDAARAAYGELNERQKGMITDAELAKLDKLAASLKDYKIVKGNKAEWTFESGKDLTFTANGLMGKFQGVQVDGTTVDSKYYTVKSGSTIVTLSDDFLNSLTKGEHAIKIVFTDGVAIGTFTVKEKAGTPSTGDEANLALFGLLAIFSVAAVAALTISVKKREQ